MRSFVVCGATGRTGSVVATELRNRGHQVTAIVRNPSRAGALEARGIRVAPSSLENSDAVTAALRDAEGFFAILPENPFATDFHGLRRRIIDALATAVRESTVPHTVLLSAVAASLPEGNGPARDLHELEDALNDTGTVLTTLRASWLQENIAAVVAPATSGGIYPNFLPSADDPFPTIATGDVGRIAADLMTDTPRQETIDLIGPAYSVRQMSQVLGKALGKVLRVVDIPPPAQVPMLVQAGLSPSFAEAVAELYACLASGRVRPRGDRQLAGTTTLDATVAEILARPT